MLPLTKRQREILDYLNEFIQQNGYAPSLEEIGKRFGLSSLATVHKHLTNLQDKGFIKRAANRSRALELVPSGMTVRAVEVPLLALVAADSASLKRLYREGEARVRLQPANRRMKPIFVDQDDLRVQGVVIGVL